ncbi:ferrous iron transport protein B [[Eubacterium] cellulosolvens]
MGQRKSFTIALAGNANVGKSAIFNQLTGLDQIIGNWPGKTVERAEGRLFFEGHTLNVIDLPGIYSLSTFSIEEIVSRDYIAIERPDVIINLVDASALERNLYLTIQLLELQKPMILALNQIDFASRRGIEIDVEKLSEILEIPVVPTIAITGVGTKELLSKVIDVIEGKIWLPKNKIQYGKEIEEHLAKLENIVKDKLKQLCDRYPSRWIALKLLERDEEIFHTVLESINGRQVIRIANEMIDHIEKVHGEPSPIVMASERYSIANYIAKEVTQVISPPRIAFRDKLSALTADRILGYPILIAVMLSMFAVIFVVGGFLVNIFDNFFQELLTPYAESLLSNTTSPIITEIIIAGLSGLGAGIAIALPYIVPFYIILTLLEDSGYLPRAAFLMDNLMHKIGLHGKAFIPMLLGYGCNVPACIGCRIMETDRERFLAAFVTVLIPCAAVTVVILGLVGRYLGLHIAIALYLFNLILIFLLGRLAYRALPGEPVGLIMEMPPYRAPSITVVVKKTWTRTRDFIYVAFPFIIIGSIILETLMMTGAIWSLVGFMAPIINDWLGLPTLAGIPLIFGILRKELTLILLAELSGSTDFTQILTPIQMIVFALVTMIYIPCISTIAALTKEFGWKRAFSVSLFDIILALVIGGIAYRILIFVTL